ncbi:MAG UNVERIFIED_CONTAM: insulinase family protein [Anaerolineae bacterium]|jgi:zinc protease
MTVLLKEVHSSPIITWIVMYRIGSRNERTGQTGISHWVEHMMFKGTDRFPAGELDKAIDRMGGQWNAFTNTDYTGYYETLPADKIDLALELEADRMINAHFELEEVESERTVIISERGMYENRPTFWLQEEVSAAAFRVHGYHHEIIGDLADLQTMTREDLFQHYRTHYVPNNAIAVAVGAFNTDEMLEKIRHHYEAIPAGATPNLFVRPEPPQQGERRVTVIRPSNTSFLQIAYHVPPASHQDWFALNMLSSILSGVGGVVGNSTTRLYKALVEPELAVEIYGGVGTSIDPGLLEFSMVVRDGQTPSACEAAFDAVMDDVLQNNVTEEELLKVKKQARASFAYRTETVTSQAFSYARAENFDSYKWVDQYTERIEAVTLGDLHDVACCYLTRHNRRGGAFDPTRNEA